MEKDKGILQCKATFSEPVECFIFLRVYKFDFPAMFDARPRPAKSPACNR